MNNLVEELKWAESAIMAHGVWICFSKRPDIYAISEARRLLDQLTDELIKDRLTKEDLS